MKKVLGALAAAALLSAPAWANDSTYEKGSTSSTSQQSSQQPTDDTSTGATGTLGEDTGSNLGTGGSGSTEMKSGEMQTGEQQAQQLQGEVIRMKGSTLFLKDQSGAAVPLKISRSTKFEGISKKDLKQGTQVSAEFELKNRTENEAKSISMGTGGAGFEQQQQQGSEQQKSYEEQQGSQQGQGLEQQPSGSELNQPGTGGSGIGEESGQGGSFNAGDTDSRSKSTVPEDGSKGPAEPMPSDTY